MAEDQVKAVGNVNLTSAHFRTQALEAAKNAENLEAAQIASQEEFLESCDLNAFNPLAIARRFETIEKRVSKQGKDETKSSEEQEIARVEGVGEITDEFLRKNPELQVSALTALRSRLKDSDSTDDIIKKLQESYPDHYLADEALDFLIKTTDSKSPLYQKLLSSQNQFRTRFKREITAGRNITEEARSFSKEGIGTPTDLRQLYKDISGNPKEPTELFEELTEKYNFSQMTTVIKFLLHSIGADMRAKGSSISKPELQTLFNETRAMQAIIGIYRFFQSRMALINKEFERNALVLPHHLSFETLAKQFVKLISERYPSIDKILKIGGFLGIGDDLLAQIIIYTQFRDGMRQVAPKLFKSEKHRQDLLLTLLDTLSDIEDELDEEEEEEEDDDDQERQGS